MPALFRLICVALLCLGISLPKATAVLAQILPGARTTLVICTGTGVETITLDAQGNPAPDAPPVEHRCLAAHADLPVAPHDARLRRLPRQTDAAPRLYDALLAGRDTVVLPLGARAPPEQTARAFQRIRPI